MHWCPRSLSLITLSLACLSLADAFRIDDSNSTVQYQGAWTNHEVPDDTCQDWDHTVHYSNSSGATATLIFTGTSIAVYGSLHPPGGPAIRSLYTIDDQQPSVTFTPPQEVPTSTHQTLFYSSPWFPYGEHTLVVTNLGDQLFLDFFDVQDESVPTTPAASTTSTPTTPTQTSISSLDATQTVTVTDSAYPQASDPSETSDTGTQGTTADPQTALATKSLAPTAPTGSSPSTTRTARPSTSAPAGGPTTTPTGAAHPHANGTSSPRTLSKGAIAGIAVGSAIIVAVLGAGLWWYWRSRSRERAWLVTFEPEKMTVPDPAFRGHRPTLPGFGLGGLGSGSGSGSDASLRDALGRRGASRSAHRRSASVPSSSSSVHLVGYGYGSSTPSACSE